MSLTQTLQAARPTAKHVYVALAGILAVLVAWYPQFALETIVFVATGLVNVTPIMVPGILLAGWMTASNASDTAAIAFQNRMILAIASAAMIGAIIPVCGITVLPLMAGLLAAGVPLAPVMAFWLASPITGPAILTAAVATLGWEFAVGKVAAAVGLGLLGGAATVLLSKYHWVQKPLRDNRLVGTLGTSCGGDGGFEPAIWRDRDRRVRFYREVWSVSKLIVIVLIPAFAAEHMLNAWLQPDIVASYVGRESIWAVPLAVIVGGPAYIDAYAAMPLTRALLAHGMSPGAGLAFLVSGGVVSVWGAMAIFPILRLKPFLLYLVLAVMGSMAVGWIFDAVM